MQIRKQGRKLQCIRTVYDKAAGRGKQKVVATLPSYSVTMPTSGLEALTDAEREQLAAWLQAEKDKHDEWSRGHQLRTAPTTLPQLADTIRDGGELSADQAAAIWKGIAEVAKALRKAGHAKPTRPRKVVEPAPPVVEPVKEVKPRKPRSRKTKPETGGKLP